MNALKPGLGATLRKRLDEGLVQHLWEMGGRFCDSADQSTEDGDLRCDKHVFQNLHWGLEILLKSFLHAHGWTEASCIAEIGHDLEKALAACVGAGLNVDPEARSFIADLSRYSRSHRVAEFVDAGADGWTAPTAIKIGRRLRTAIGRSLNNHPAD